jgi:putative heme transporter
MTTTSDSARPAPPDGGRTLHGAASLSLRFLLVVAALYVLLRLLNAVSLVTITVVVALLVTALLQPAVAWLVRRGLPRPLAATAVFVLGIVAIGLAAWFVVSQVASNATSLGDQLRSALAAIQTWLVHGPPHLSAAQVGQIGTDIQNAVSANRAGILSGVFATASSALGVISGAVLCLFAIFFMMLDDGSIWRWIVGLFPDREEPRVDHAGQVAWRTLSAYMRSCVVLAFINALTMVIVMLVAGLPLVVPLGVLLFLGSLIPLVGMIVAGVVVVLVALVTKSLAVAIVMAVALVLTVQLEGNLLNPWILGKAVNIHPLGVLLAVTSGTILGGVFGAFIAVPLVAVLNNVRKTVRMDLRLTDSAVVEELSEGGDLAAALMGDPPAGRPAGGATAAGGATGAGGTPAPDTPGGGAPASR